MRTKKQTASAGSTTSQGPDTAPPPHPPPHWPLAADSSFLDQESWEGGSVWLHSGHMCSHTQTVGCGESLAPWPSTGLHALPINVRHKGRFPKPGSRAEGWGPRTKAQGPLSLITGKRKGMGPGQKRGLRLGTDHKQVQLLTRAIHLTHIHCYLSPGHRGLLRIRINWCLCLQERQRLVQYRL